uniref:Uncharacterized protein n=1 Tax=Helianthus annuus TaxID=4232 RepID=A0A251VLF7_HELAN
MKGQVHAILGANLVGNGTDIWNTYQLLTGQGIMGTRGSRTDEWNKENTMDKGIITHEYGKYLYYRFETV